MAVETGGQGVNCPHPPPPPKKYFDNPKIFEYNKIYISV